MEFNPDFVARMIPKVEWEVLLEAADHVRTLPLAWDVGGGEVGVGVDSLQPFVPGQSRGSPEMI